MYLACANELKNVYHYSIHLLKQFPALRTYKNGKEMVIAFEIDLVHGIPIAQIYTKSYFVMSFCHKVRIYL